MQRERALVRHPLLHAFPIHPVAIQPRRTIEPIPLIRPPSIDVHFIEDEQIPWGGIGEVGLPPAAPALVNALAAAGKRVRRLPVIG